MCALHPICFYMQKIHCIDFFSFEDSLFSSLSLANDNKTKPKLLKIDDSISSCGFFFVLHMPDRPTLPRFYFRSTGEFQQQHQQQQPKTEIKTLKHKQLATSFHRISKSIQCNSLH